MSERELSSVNAQSGIVYVIGNSQLRITRDSYRISDTDSSPLNWIEFNNVTVDDGSGGYFSLDTPFNYDDMNTIDVATDPEGMTAVALNLSTSVLPRTYTVGNFVFCNQDIGSLRLQNLSLGASNKLLIGARAVGSGINLDYQTNLIIDSAIYTYNTTPSSLSLNGLHLSQTATAIAEDADPLPSTWTYEGKYRFGDWTNSNPWTIDVGTADNGDGTTTTSVFYNIPMTGTIRVQEVNFGGTSFGPCAIDGINVHHMGIQIPGN